VGVTILHGERIEKILDLPAQDRPNGQLEDRDDLVALDADLGHVGFDDRFALAGCAASEDVGEQVADVGEFGGRGWGGLGRGVVADLRAAGLELVQAGVGVTDPLAAGLVVEGAGFRTR